MSFRHVLTLSTLLCTSVTPMVVSSSDGASDKAHFANIWKSAELYGDKKNNDYPFIKLRGRYHGQSFWADGSTESEHDWEHRRLRLGLDVSFTDKLKLSFDYNIGTESEDDFFNDVDFLTLSYAIDKNTSLAVGKIRRPLLTREDGDSSNSILTLERSVISSSFFKNVGGVYFKQKSGDYSYGTALLKGNTDGDNKELPTTDGATIFAGHIGKKVTSITEVRFDYLHNPGDPDNNQVAPYQNVYSLNTQTQSGPWGVMTDLIYADGSPEASGNLYGAVIIPHYDLTNNWQLVGRYAFAGSDDQNGVRLPSRYERRVAPDGYEFGDHHEAVYLGLNYYIYGNKLKIMSGVEYTEFESVNGSTSFLTGNIAIRMYF